MRGARGVEGSGDERKRVGDAAEVNLVGLWLSF